MNINDQFGSNKFLKSADLQGNVVQVKIQTVQVEKLGDDRKMVMYFAGKDKGMVLNKTNAMTIGDAYGEDTDDWIGKPIEIFSMKVEFQGRMVDGLRVRVPKRIGAQQERTGIHGPAPQSAPAHAEELDDEIPF